MTELHDKLALLVFFIWRGIDATRKSKYRMTIWTEFENAIRLSAYTNKIGKFVEKLCGKLDAQVGKNDEERAQGEALLRGLKDDESLKLLREETSLIVLITRTMNDTRREAAQTKFEFEKEQEETE